MLLSTSSKTPSSLLPLSLIPEISQSMGKAERCNVGYYAALNSIKLHNFGVGTTINDYFAPPTIPHSRSNNENFIFLSTI
jgi:hypothetical protein